MNPVRLYLRDMGAVELLSREGEIAIAKRIEAGREKMIGAICESPMTIRSIINWFIVASGSPGPLDKKIPFGLLSKISFIELDDGNIVVSKLSSFKFLRILCLIPKSKQTIGKFL